jgi:hypothetical protein
MTWSACVPTAPVSLALHARSAVLGDALITSMYDGDRRMWWSAARVGFDRGAADSKQIGLVGSGSFTAQVLSVRSVSQAGSVGF